MKMKPTNSIFTDEQWEAVVRDNDNENILVSAGAGSGKTAVLSERVIEKVKDGIHINKLIIITFTKAAAFEMKTRIKEKLEKLVEEDNRYKEELNLLEEAMICTYDSLSLNIVKKYHYLLGIGKNISIVDNLDLDLKKEEIINNIFEKYYQDNEDFKEMIDLYTVKDDKSIIEAVMKFYDKVEIKKSPIEFLDNYLDEHFTDLYYSKIKEDYLNFLGNLRDSYLTTINALKLTEVDPDYVPKILAKLENLSYAKTYDDYKKAFDGFRAPSLSQNDYSEEEWKLIKKYRDKIDKIRNEIKNATSYDSMEDIIGEIKSIEKYILVFRNIIKELFIRLDKYKKEINAYTFRDITRLAIEVLEFDEPKKEFENIDEIMIDEFQDTNDIGELFVSKMSHNNVYMVGDVKQSIYRFNNANPGIFMDKYKNYKNNDGGHVIDLVKNFRSRKEVLEDINMIFAPILDLEVGGADYTNGHAMEFGNNTYEENKEDRNYHIEIFDYENKNVETEALIIAKDIKEKINSKLKVVRKDKLDDITYADFAIIISAKSNFDIYKKVLEEEGIPSLLYSATPFASSNEVYVIKNILSLINKKRLNNSDIKYNFISIARSYLFNYQDNDIFAAVTNNDIETNPIFKEIFSHIDNLVMLSKKESLSNLLISIYKEFDMYSKSIRLGNVDLINKKLDHLIDVFKSLEELNYNFDEILMYLDNIYKGKEDIEFSEKPDTSINAVRIMSIHASKGLEFSYCYFPELTRGFNKQDTKGSYLYDDRYGFIIPITKEGKKETILKVLATNNYIKEDVSEKIRNLYVALTRAKEKIILVAPFKTTDYLPLPFDTKVDTLVRTRYNSFMEIFLSIKNILNDYIVFKEVDETKVSLKEPKQIKKESYSFNEKYLDIHSKTIKKESYSHTRNEIKKIENKQGTLVHEVLEYLDFHNYLEDINNYELDNYLKEKILKLFNVIDIENAKVYKEYEFYNNGVSGIIDLMIEKEDKIIIVDYKLKDIDEDYYIDQVKGYTNYIKTITNKPVIGYLYSILDEKYKIID